MPILKMQHDKNPADEITSKVKEALDDIQLNGANVLIGIYERPEKTQGGIILTQQYREEDIWQGKVGLILKIGNLPFDEDDNKFFGGKLPKEGDWIAFRPSDGWPLVIGADQQCRMLDDCRRIKMILSSPDCIW